MIRMSLRSPLCAGPLEMEVDMYVRMYLASRPPLCRALQKDNVVCHCGSIVGIVISPKRNAVLSD